MCGMGMTLLWQLRNEVVHKEKHWTPIAQQDIGGKAAFGSYVELRKDSVSRPKPESKVSSSSGLMANRPGRTFLRLVEIQGLYQ
ncbi:hypothetical protein JG688_00015860 [Phytophthora aleatoria]|uniref:Uncharacterized protein n=1 Tax=Phytophthora aleatoria TaxID=2496075 RepID=A0A8J5MD63_9STRA|nr:hypothetical protein JG688_00015860 [Phytophthora aleatoria]